jgi:hypothetical protein
MSVRDPLGDLYRRSARERSLPALDARILAEAGRQARINAWLMRAKYLGLAAAAMILLMLDQSSPTGGDRATIVPTKYAATTRPYLLQMKISATDAPADDVQDDDAAPRSEDSE